MSDLISRQAAIDALKGIAFDHNFERGEYIGEDVIELSILNAEKAYEKIEELPSAQPEIVRCADCDLYKKTGCPLSIFVGLPKPDDFCSCGRVKALDEKS